MKRLLEAGGFLALAVGLLLAATMTAVAMTSEVKTASLEGLLVLPDGKSPLPKGEILLEPEFEVADGVPASFYFRADQNGFFRASYLPEGLYSARVYGKAHGSSHFVRVGKPADETVELKQAYGNIGPLDLDWARKSFENQLAKPEPGTERVVFTTEATMPDFELRGAQRVYLPDEKPVLSIAGLGKENQVEFDLFEVSEDALLRTGSQGLAYQLQNNGSAPLDPSKLGAVKKTSFSHTIRTRDLEGQFAENIDVPSLAEGNYLLRGRLGDKVAAVWLQVTRLALVARVGQDALLYTVDLETGKPVAGAQIRSAQRSLGATNADGTLRVPLDGNGPFSIVASHGASKAFTYGYSYSNRSAGSTIWVETDRPIYRPGDTVQFRAVVRRAAPNGYAVPPTGDLRVELRDSRSDLVGTQNLSLNSHGSASGAFEIADYATPGSFGLVAKTIDGEQYTTVVVAAYRKPEFEIEVQPQSEFVIRGDRIRAKVLCKYLTGEPLAGAKAEVSMYRNPIWSGDPFEDEGEWDSTADASYLGDWVESASVVTDAQGVAWVEFPSRGEWSDSGLYDEVVTLEADVQDPGGRLFSGKGKLTIARGLVDLRSEVDRYLLAPSEPVEVRFHGELRQTKAPAAGAQVDVEWARELYGRKDVKFVPIGKRTIQLDEKGEGSVRVSSEDGGSLVVRASTRDSRGNTIRTESNLYVFGSNAAAGPEAPSLKVVLDKKKYKPGETAIGLIMTDKPGGSALVTLDSNGLRWSRVVPLEGGATRIEIPAPGSVAPNGQVHVAYVREKSFQEASRPLNVDLTEHRLSVEVIPAATTAKPGQTMAYTITTRDENGTPVSAETSVSVVDEGVYIIREDDRDPLAFFYPRRYSSMGTFMSFPEVYLDGGDKSKVDREFRKDFKDTAFWSASVQTDGSGRAQVEVPLPDNLTRWRTTVMAVSDATQVGAAKCEVTVKKDLMARLTVPSFAREGDRIRLAATLTNTTAQPLSTNVELAVVGAKLEGNAKRAVRLDAEGSATETFEIVAGRVGRAKFQLTAESGELRDALEQTLVIQPLGLEKATYAAGRLGAESRSVLEVPANAAGVLEVDVLPNPAAAAIPALEYLLDYPYTCVEQTVSRLVPSLYMAQFLEGSQQPIRERLPEEIARSIEKLRQMQHPDGGWGWWEYDASDEEMTALALDALLLARDRGISIPAEPIDSAVRWARERMKKPVSQDGWVEQRRDWTRARVALAEVVGRIGAFPEIAANLSPSLPLNELDTPTLALLSLALAERDSDRAQKAFDTMMARAEETETTLHWADEWSFEPTSYAIRAMQVFEPESPRYEKVLTYLVLSRRGHAWASTRDTAVILQAMASYYGDEMGAVSSGSSVALFVGDRRVGSGEVGTTRFRIDLKDVPAGGPVRIEAPGSESGFFSATLRQFVPSDQAKPSSTLKGMKLERSYHRTGSKRLENGTIERSIDPKTISRAKSGELIRVRLVLETPGPQSFVAIEDPIPANCRIVDSEERSDGWEEEGLWGYWWSRSAFFDDHAALFVRDLPKGRHVFEYTIRAEFPGVCSANPATVWRMYQPDLRANSAANSWTVDP